MSEDTDDRMAVIKAEVDAKYAIFSAKRQKLILAYQRAPTHKGQLRALAKALRHHHSYMANSLMGGWYVESLLEFAKAIDYVADDLDD